MVNNVDKDVFHSKLSEYVSMITRPSKKGGRGMHVCPFCGSGSHDTPDSDGAFHVTGEVWFCQACKQGGDIFTLYAKLHDLDPVKDFPKIIEGLAQELGIDVTADDQRIDEGYRKHKKEQKAVKKVVKQDNPERAAKIEEYASQLPGSPAEVYLKERCISDENIARFKLGYNPNRYVRSTGKNYESLVIPYPGEDYYTERLLNPGKADKYQNQPGEAPTFVINGNDSDCYFITEGQIDAISMVQCGANNVIASHYPSKIENLIKSGFKIEGAVIVADRDEEVKRNSEDGLTPGERTAKNIEKVLSDRQIKSIIAFPPEGYKDANDILKGDPQILHDLLLQWAKELRKKLSDVAAPVSLAEIYKIGFPDLEPEIMKGVLRRMGKLLLIASSKAGKTQLLVILSVVFDTGGIWLGIECIRQKVLYVNFELTAAQMYNRFNTVYAAMKRDPADSNIIIWNLKGQYDQIFPVDKNFVPKLISTAKTNNVDVIILDPIYKLLQEDENASKTVSEFCRFTDQIVQETGAALIYTHHHAKGNQSSKAAIDRGSGSGVFGRDADAVLDLTEIEPSDCGVVLEEGQAAFRMEFGGLRSFKRKDSIEVVSDYPLFVVRDDLRMAKIKEGCRDSKTNGQRGNRKKQEKRDSEVVLLRNIVKYAAESGRAFTIEDAAAAMGKSKNTIRNWIKLPDSGMNIYDNDIYLETDDEMEDDLNAVQNA